MIFTIRQYSELPVLQLQLFNDGRNEFKNFEDKLENSTITFAMKDQTTGIYKVANKEAEIVLKTPCDTNSKKEYYITYTFTTSDTKKPGIYLGEFKIIFLDETLQSTGSLIIPIREELQIHVIDSFVKSDIVYI